MPYVLKPITYIMQASLVLPMSDPIEIVCSEKSPLELYRLAFPEDMPSKKLLKVLENAPPQKGIFTAVVWNSDFGIHPAHLTSVFQNATSEHKGKMVRVRAPTLQEYLEFQRWLFIPCLVGQISHQEDLFYYDEDYHEEFNVCCNKGLKNHFPDYMYALEGDEVCKQFLLIVEDF